MKSLNTRDYRMIGVGSVIFFLVSSVCTFLSTIVDIGFNGYFIKIILTSFLSIAGWVLLFVSLFNGKPTPIIGIGLHCVSYLIRLISAGFYIGNVFSVLFWIFLAVVCLTKVKPIAFLAMLMELIRFIVWAVQGHFFVSSLFLNMDRVLFMIVFAYVLSCVICGSESKAAAVPSKAAGISVGSASTSSVVEKLERLKMMLDNNVITQDEFNEKKKQLLNL